MDVNESVSINGTLIHSDFQMVGILQNIPLFLLVKPPQLIEDLSCGLVSVFLLLLHNDLLHKFSV